MSDVRFSFLGKRTKRIFTWQPFEKMQHWFEENVVLTRSARAGKFQTRYVPHAKEIFEDIDRQEVNIATLKSASQVIKALTLDTKIPTINGYKLMKDVEVGDILFDDRGEQCCVTHVSETFINKDIYEVKFNDGNTVKCSGDHYWTVFEKLRDRREEKTLTTLEMLNTIGFNTYGHPKFSIPYSAPLRHNKKLLPIEPYTLGVWLGDGNALGNGYSNDFEDEPYISKEIRKEGYYTSTPRRDSRNRMVRVLIDGRGTPAHNNNSFGVKLINNNLINNKHIPEIYFLSSVKQRLRLFQGLMDTDGGVSKQNNISYFSSSIPKLADDFERLIKSLGLKYTRVLKKTTHKDSHQFTMMIYKEHLKAFRLPRKRALQKSIKATTEGRIWQVKNRYIISITKIETEHCKCISVDSPNKLYLCTENNIPTHNTTIGMGFIMKYIATDPTDSMIMIPRATDLKIYSENKLKPFIQGVPVVETKFQDFKSVEKVRDNSYVYRFAGGVLNLLSSNNPKTISVKYALFDEVSEFSRGKVGEALERMKSYLMFGYKALIVSTQEHEDDEINFYFNSSEVKKQYYMYCGGCQGYFYPDEKHIKYMSLSDYKKETGIADDYDLKDFEVISDYLPYVAPRGYLECPHCEHHITDGERRTSILAEKLKWFQVVPLFKEEEDAPIEYEIAKNPKKTYKTVGFDVNTLCMYNVPLSESIEKLIKASVSKDKDVELDYFYRGYLNKIYKANRASVISKNDILLLTNGYEAGVVPKDTWKLILTADNQKDHLYYKVIAIGYDNFHHTVQHGKLQGYGDNEDFDALEELMFSDFHDKHGEVCHIDHVGIDRRGYVSEKDGADRIADVDAFVLRIQNKLKINGHVEPEKFIFAMQGVANIAGDKYYRFNKVKREFQDEEVELNILVHNNLLVKNRLNVMITRSIEKAKAEEGDDALSYDREMYYINQDIVDNAVAKGKSTAEDYERMMTSEQFGFEIIDGKTAKNQSWFKRKGVKRNDYWDCSAMGVCLAVMLGVEFAVRPVPEDKNAALDVINDLF